MTSDRTAIIGGILILVGGLALAVYANINIEAFSQAKARTVNKYISLSEKALKNGETRNAEKFALKALTTDPSNKNAISNFKVAYIPAPVVKNNADDAKKPMNNQPKKPAPQAEAEEEMGCI